METEQMTDRPLVACAGGLAQFASAAVKGKGSVPFFFFFKFRAITIAIPTPWDVLRISPWMQTRASSAGCVLCSSSASVHSAAPTTRQIPGDVARRTTHLPKGAGAGLGK